MMSIGKLYLLLLLVLPTGCMSAADHQRNLGSAQQREMTLGVVQKEIHMGMSQANVASVLGSPNIVSKDEQGNETWIYDKIASEVSYSNSAFGVSLKIGGLLTNPADAASSSGFSQNSGAASSTQKTLTVIIRYNKQGIVESLTYHTSKF